jgi:IclR family transcriptional regulator, KDG regulon repressor
MKEPLSKGGSVGERTARSLTVEKALKLLDAVAAQTEPSSLLTLSQAAGLEKTTTHRLATSLTRFGVLRFDPIGHRYALGLRLAEYGHQAMAQLSLPREGHEYLVRLGTGTAEVVNLGIYDDGAVVFVDQVQSPQSVVIRARIGTRIPAHCTSSGKALLAFGPARWLQQVIQGGLPSYTPNTITDPDELEEGLGRVRRLGYAIDDEEHRPGVRCVAVPVFNPAGLAIASMSVAAPAFRLTRERITEILEQLQEAAGDLSATLGFDAEANASAVGHLTEVREPLSIPALEAS